MCVCTLITRVLNCDNILSIGVKALLTCVFDNSKLNAISESNLLVGNVIISMLLRERCCASIRIDC
jgi:hypothetical protein